MTFALSVTENATLTATLAREDNHRLRTRTTTAAETFWRTHAPADTLRAFVIRMMKSAQPVSTLFQSQIPTLWIPKQTLKHRDPQTQTLNQYRDPQQAPKETTLS